MSEISNVSLLNQMNLLKEKTQSLGVEALDQPGFSDIFKKTIGSVNELNQNADNLRTRFELGDNNVGIGKVVVEAQKANLAFEATKQVTKRFLEAYKDIMNMPI